MLVLSHTTQLEIINIRTSPVNIEGETPPRFATVVYSKVTYKTAANAVVNLSMNVTVIIVFEKERLPVCGVVFRNVVTRCKCTWVVTV